MQLPFFYIPSFDGSNADIELEEESSRHVVQVLRKKTGDQLNLTDGLGHLLTVTIVDDHRRHTRVRVDEVAYTKPVIAGTTIAISLVKNSSRFEWFLEKATEIGVTAIIPLICARTEKEKFRADRLRQILVSAMLQSRQTWLPLLHQPIAFDGLFALDEINAIPLKFIAHCTDELREDLVPLPASQGSRIMLIGPEGDFTTDEIHAALGYGYKPVSLGENRLRTETAGIVAVTLLKAS